jgi:hypothetical protein
MIYFCPVKNSIRISSVLLLAAIYCFSIGIGTKSHIFSGLQTTEQEKYFSAIFTILSPHTPQAESSVNNFNDFQAPGFKNLLGGLWAVIKTTEQFYESVFSQYTSFSLNVLIHHRKTDIIFPFHYFW